MEEFKQLSIRARMAFGIVCLEAVLSKAGYNQPILQVLLDRLKEFVETDRLDSWEERIGDVAPYAVLDDHPVNDFAEYQTIASKELTELESLYLSMPNTLTDMIDSVINIGESNLYGGVGEYSKDSFDALVNVVKQTREFDVALPDLKKFMKSPFSEYAGWGNKRSFVEFK